MYGIQRPHRYEVVGLSLLREIVKTTKSSLIGSFLFRVLRAFLDRVFGGFFPEVFLINGVVKGSDVVASVLFIGHEELAYQFARLVYSRIEKMHCFGSFLPFQIDPSRFHDADIVVIRANERLLNKLVDKGFFLLPYTRFGLDLRVPMSRIVARTEHGRRRAIRRTENLDYSYTIQRNDKQAFDFFYWKMYLPYAKKRFGKAAITITYRQMKAIYDRNGGILLVKKKGQLIWGNLFQIRQNMIYDQYLGANVKTKVLGEKVDSHVTYFFLIQWAKTQNIMEYDGGIALPFFSDGIFKYKRGWGMFVRKQGYEPSWALRLNTPSEGGLSLLEKNPFIFMDDGKIKSVVFVRQQLKDDEAERLLSKFCIPQLDSSLVVAYYQSAPSSTKGEVTPNAQLESEMMLPKPLSYVCSLLLRRGYDFAIYEQE
jgi:hypothetical protein